jgi:serine/threonine protein kinase
MVETLLSAGSGAPEAQGRDETVVMESPSVPRTRPSVVRTVHSVSGAAALPVREVSASDLSGHRLGAYELIHRVGKGGMGSVYAARRVDEFTKMVAVKVVKPGMETEDILLRFKHERQVLASLDHPGIARLLDGGTENGMPYLVMEYVEGTPIDTYCTEHRLSVTDRLNLFCEVCSAVQYAHQSLVVHRDLKPSNIIVTADGRPKLLDFGIAKVLNTEFSDNTAMTQLSERPMTPDYASPEQVRRRAHHHFERRVRTGSAAVSAAYRPASVPAPVQRERISPDRVRDRSGASEQPRRQTARHADYRSGRAPCTAPGPAEGRSRRNRDDGAAKGAAAPVRIGAASGR